MFKVAQKINLNILIVENCECINKHLSGPFPLFPSVGKIIKCFFMHATGLGGKKRMAVYLSIYLLNGVGPIKILRILNFLVIIQNFNYYAKNNVFQARVRRRTKTSTQLDNNTNKNIYSINRSREYHYVKYVHN